MAGPNKSLSQKKLDLQIALLQFHMLSDAEKVVLVSSLSEMDVRIVDDIATEITKQAPFVSRAT